MLKCPRCGKPISWVEKRTVGNNVYYYAVHYEGSIRIGGKVEKKVRKCYLGPEEYKYFMRKGLGQVSLLSFIESLKEEEKAKVEIPKKALKEKEKPRAKVILKTELSRGDLESLLKKGADLIRTRVDYKYLLVLLFLKRISDIWIEEYEKTYNDLVKNYGLSPAEAREEAKAETYHRFNIPEECLWDNIRKEVSKLPEKLAESLKRIAELNPELRGVIDRLDFITFTQSRENFEILRQLVELFSKYNLSNKYVSSDVIGDAYEWVLKYFAPQRGKEGEVFTPREVIKLLMEILDPKPGESVCDPACGPAGMLITAYKHVREKYGRKEADKLRLYGQEVNHDIYALAKMNLLIHDILNAKVELGDSLLYPKFTEKGKLMKFNIVVANPPWNQDGYGEETLKKAEFKERFRYGYPPNNSADWAWIQHMISIADDKKGRVGIVIDNGCLFRGGRERNIRRKIINEDLIECIILLPEKLFYHSALAGAIMILNKNKPKERKGKILFINASNEYVPHPTVKRLNMLSNGNIKKIANAYKKFANIPGFSRVVDIKEIKNNDYNLNVNLYVMPLEEEEAIDITEEYFELKKLEAECQEIEKRLEEYISQLTQLTGSRGGN